MGLFSSVGKLLNNVTGVSSSASKGFQYSSALQNQSFEQQKYFAQNAHQLEMQDLKKAGLNPALSALNGATASGGGTASISGGNGAGLGAIGVLADVYNSTRATSANNKLADAQAALNNAQAIRSIEMLPLDKREKRHIIENLTSSTKFNNERARGFSESTTYSGNIKGGLFGGGGSKSSAKTW